MSLKYSIAKISPISYLTYNFVYSIEHSNVKDLFSQIH